MDYEQLQRYQQSLLDRALTEGIRRNEEQTQTWSEYKARHEKVTEGLKTFSQDLTVECMVPIGKKALMRGKLTHTNEILVSLGEGYFAKYSAPQALALCDRRIKKANDFLESLAKERDLYEMRQRIPEYFDAFGSDERKDLIEHWKEEKLDDWRVEHRQREKEYRKKLAELKNIEKQDVKTEDDLFAKLDALELQEELEAELHRLEAKRPDFYTQDLGEGEAYEESDESSEETEGESDEEEEEKDNESEKKMDREETHSRLEEAQAKVEDESTISRIVVSSSDDKFPASDCSVVESSEKIVQNISVSTRVKPEDTPIGETKAVASIVDTSSEEASGKRVVFGESQVKYYDEEEQITLTDEQEGVFDVLDEEDSSDDSIVRIEFEHSKYEPEIVENDDEGESITSPRDIYEILSKPKSILKNSAKSPIREVDNLPPDDDSTDEEIEDGQPRLSAYNTVVRDIREYVIDKPYARNIKPVEEEKRPVSKFKRERAGMRK